MGVLLDIFKIVDGAVTAVFTVVLGAISLLLQGAVWLIGVVLSLTTAVIDWIDDKIDDWWDDKEEAHKDGAKATIINGEALSSFITQQQKTGNYREITLSELNKIHNSTINVMSDKYGKSDADMVGAEKGYDSELRNGFFKGKGYVSVSV